MQIGLIGAGRWGKRYIETLNRMPGVHLACLASKNPESIKLAPEGCHVTPDWREVTENRELDGVILATPPATHLELALSAIRTGVPVLVEKPMTLSVADARTLANESASHGVLTMVGHTHLYSAAFRELKRQGMSLGALQHVRSVGGNWGPFRSDAPMLWDWAPHDIAMCLDIFGSFPCNIHATRTGKIEQAQETGEAVTILLDFASGGSAEIRVSNIEQHKQRIFEATYVGGTLSYDDLAQNKLAYTKSPGATAEPIQIDQSMPLTNLVAEFCSAIEEGQHSSPSLLIGLQVVEILEKCDAILDGSTERVIATAGH